VPTGTVFRLTLSEAARVTFTIERRRSGDGCADEAAPSALRSGRYRVTARARDSSIQRSASVRAAFRIVP
jgi:hypothetical protein